MKKAGIIIGLAVVILFTILTLMDDFKQGRGIFMTTATYREYVKEGKETK